MPVLLKRETLTEDKLCQGLANGDPRALEDLMKGYSPVLCKYAESFVADSFLARDVVQEVFVKLWQYNGTFDDIPSLKAFLFTVTKNGCLNMLRSRERLNSKHYDAARFNQFEVQPVYDQIVKLEYIAQINQIVQQMPQKMQEVFLLSFEEGLSIAQIAEKLNVTVKTVRNQKYRSLIMLRKQLGSTGIPLLILLYKVFSNSQ